MSDQAASTRPRAPHMTRQIRAVLEQFLTDPGRELYGREIIEATGLANSAVYPILRRLTRIGWLSGRLEHAPYSRIVAPAPGVHRYYRLTDHGQRQAREKIRRTDARRRARRGNPG